MNISIKALAIASVAFGLMTVGAQADNRQNPGRRPRPLGIGAREHEEAAA